MAAKVRILAVTDHSSHREGESIYPLLSSMKNHKQCGGVHVVSRGDARNRSFFADFNSNKVFAKRIDNEFSYAADGEWYRDACEVEVNDFHVIFLRLDRPVSDAQLISLKNNYATKLIINEPTGILETGSKLFLLKFPAICPGVTLVRSVDEICIKEQAIVLKPLDGFGGKGLIKVSENAVLFGDDVYSHEAGMRLLEKRFAEFGPMISMHYMHNVANGDKRVIVVGGEVVGATVRYPAKGSWLCNLAQGGTSAFAEADRDEIDICNKISPTLLERGVIIFGIDTLEADDGTRILSEINTLNVGGLLQAQIHSGIPVIEITVQKIFVYIQSRLD